MLRKQKLFLHIGEHQHSQVIFSSAVKNADIVILSIPFEAIAGFMEEYTSDLEGKIIVDPSNPIAPDKKGGFKKVIGEKESAGEINTSALPKNARLGGMRSGILQAVLW